MFNSISWQGYWIAIALLTVLYYLIICLLYYRSHLCAWIQHLQGRRPKITPSTSVPFLHSQPNESSGKRQPSLFEAETAIEFSLPPKDSEEHIVYSYMDELNAFFEQAKRTKWMKEELIGALKRLLLKYPSLKVSEYKESISNVLITECEHHCSIHLSAEDIVIVWTGKGE